MVRMWYLTIGIDVQAKTCDEPILVSPHQMETQCLKTIKQYNGHDETTVALGTSRVSSRDPAERGRRGWYAQA